MQFWVLLWFILISYRYLILNLLHYTLFFTEIELSSAVFATICVHYNKFVCFIGIYRHALRWCREKRFDQVTNFFSDTRQFGSSIEESVLVNWPDYTSLAETWKILFQYNALLLFHLMVLPGKLYLPTYWFPFCFFVFVVYIYLRDCSLLHLFWACLPTAFIHMIVDISVAEVGAVSKTTYCYHLTRNEQQYSNFHSNASQWGNAPCYINRSEVTAFKKGYQGVINYNRLRAQETHSNLRTKSQE